MAMHAATTFPTQELRPFYEALLLKTAERQFKYNKFGVQREVPANYGRSINFRRFERIAAATTALTEGSAGAETAFSITLLNATLSQYGKPA